MIKIGISACFSYPDAHRKVFAPKTLSYIENDMARYLTQKGILPVLIPDVSDDLLDDILSEMDGFVFQGGTDIAPEFYHESPIENGRWPGDPVRDEYEFRLFDRAFKSGKPILAICRGMQLMNIYFGGTLYQDTITQRPESLIHRDADLYDTISHEINWARGKILHQIYQSDPATKVNSVHHQSIKDLGQGLEILATSPEDGIIEAIGHTKSEEGKIVGVQWHPEFSHTLGGEVIDPDPLYRYFIEQVRKKRQINLL